MSEPAKITYLEPNAMQASRAFSPAVITQGGRTVWLAGQTTTTDLDGRDISGDFSAQAHACFFSHRSDPEKIRRNFGQSSYHDRVY